MHSREAIYISQMFRSAVCRLIPVAYKKMHVKKENNHHCVRCHVKMSPVVKVKNNRGQVQMDTLQT